MFYNKVCLKNRRLGIDILRIICAFLIICIHTNNYPGFLIPIMRMAVPVFFMITGYFVINDFSQQIKKVFILLCEANLLYFAWILFKYFMGFSSGISLSEIFKVENIVYILAFNMNPITSHLWYLGAIIYVYLFVYLIKKHLKGKWLYCIALFLYIIGLSLEYVFPLIFSVSVPLCVYRNFLFMGIPFFLLGAYFRDYPVKCNSLFLLLSCIASCALNYCEAFFWKSNYRSSIFIPEFYICTPILASSVFLLFLKIENKKDSKELIWLAGFGKYLTTWIYIIHPIVIELIDIIIKQKKSGKVMTFIDRFYLLDFYYYFRPLWIFLLSAIVVFVLRIIIMRSKEGFIYILDKR